MVGDFGPRSARLEEEESQRAPTTERLESRREPGGGGDGGSMVQWRERREKSMLWPRANSCMMAVSKVSGWVTAERGTEAGKPLDTQEERKLARSARSATNWTSVKVVG